jgi:hypothetical protein
MKKFYIILISLALSACDSGDDPASNESQSGGLGQYPSEQTTGRREDSHPARVSEDLKDPRGNEMKDFLNSAAPPWLTLGSAIRPEEKGRFDLNTKNLREVDLPDKFINPNDPYLEVLSSANREVHIRTLTGDHWIRLPENP